MSTISSNDTLANNHVPYQQCSYSVMDTISDPYITFDPEGVCNYFHEYKDAEHTHVFTGDVGLEKLNKIFKKIIDSGKGKRYDCILGLSGGVDSTYLCLLAKQSGLNPLIVHCDNGWNSELAVRNIENTVKRLDFDLYTYVINWEDFKSLQLAYLKASVVDIEVLTDHAFMAVLYEQARKFRIKYVLAGMNIVTEHVLPKYWIFDKSDATNIKSIYKMFGDRNIKEIKTFPFLSYKTKRFCNDVLKMQVISPLNYIDYNYEHVKAIIKDELDWQDYGGKHHESIWTRFYQGYILPEKFLIDKRKAHFSNLIYSGQLTKEDALEKLAQPIYDTDILLSDKEFVLKKFNLSIEEFEKIMSQERVEHSSFETEKGFWRQYPSLSWLKPIFSALFKK